MKRKPNQAYQYYEVDSFGLFNFLFLHTTCNYYRELQQVRRSYYGCNYVTISVSFRFGSVRFGSGIIEQTLSNIIYLTNRTDIKKPFYVIKLRLITSSPLSYLLQAEDCAHNEGFYTSPPPLLLYSPYVKEDIVASRFEREVTSGTNRESA